MFQRWIGTRTWDATLRFAAVASVVAGVAVGGVAAAQEKARTKTPKKPAEKAPTATAADAEATKAGEQAGEKSVARKIVSIEGITEYRLDNGLKVLLFPDSSKATVTVNLTVFVGSRHEGYGEAGMAHLLEHMLFKGTPTHPQVPKVLQERGARFNGTTWVDRTNYFETLPASDENLEFAVRLEADRMVNSFVRGEDLASEMTVVRNEFESGENQPGRVLTQRMMSAAFEWHNYGRSTIGNRADIERVPIDKLRAFYRKYYQPDNAMLVVAGKFDPAKALAVVESQFGPIPRPSRTLDTTYTEEPAQDGERIVTLRRVGQVALVGASYHIPAGPHPDYEPLDVLESILTAPPSGRLYKALIETKKASDLSGVAFAWHDPGVLRLVAEVARGQEPQAILDEMLEIVESIGEKGVTAEEVDRAKARLLKDRELAAAETSGVAVQLSEWAAMGDWRLFFVYRDRLEKVAAEDVQRVASTYLRRNNRTVGLFLPTEKPERISVPAKPDLAAMIGDYKGREAVVEGEAFDVAPLKIEARTQRVKLPSGVQATLVPKKTRGETVSLRLTLRYGDADNLQGMAKAAEFLPSLMVRGTANRTRQQIQDELDKYRAQLGASGQAGEISFSIKTKRQNLPALLDLLRQVAREPSLPAAELEILKQGSLGALEEQLHDPSALASRFVNRQVNPYPSNDPRYIPTIAEEIERVKAVSVDDVAKLYREYLGGTVGELSIVGDFAPDETLPAVNAILADWKAAKPYARLERSGDVKLKASVETIQTPDKANATYFAGTVFPLRDDHPDYPALALGNFILGGGSLSSRLGDRVRQKEGLSYGVGSGLRSSSVDARTSFYIYAIANPQNVEKLKAVIREELEKILQEGVTEQELETAKRGFLQRLEVGRTDDAALAAALAETSFAGRTLEFDAKQEEAVRKLTPDDVRAALKKYLSLDRLVLAIAGDLK